MSLLVWIVGAIVSALIGLILTVLFQDQVSIALVKVFRGVGIDHGRSSLSGNWYSYYYLIVEKGTSESAKKHSHAVLTIRLRQVGNRVAGTGTGKSHNYSALATFEDSCLTGKWRNAIEGRYSRGTFQLYCHSNGRWMTGKFSGQDSENHINHGVWLWMRRQDDPETLTDDLTAYAQWSFDKGYVAEVAALEPWFVDALGRDASRAALKKVNPSI
jgi:hypothetical protein